jgi:hypothetical protein
METVDLSLDIAYVEDVTRFKVVNGQEFDLILKGYDEAVDYASTGDPVLDIKASQESDKVVSISAKEVGLSRFFFIKQADSGIETIKELRIEVVPAIVDPAVTLGLTGEVIAE